MLKSDFSLYSNSKKNKKKKNYAGIEFVFQNFKCYLRIFLII